MPSQPMMVMPSCVSPNRTTYILEFFLIHIVQSITYKEQVSDPWRILLSKIHPTHNHCTLCYKYIMNLSYAAMCRPYRTPWLILPRRMVMHLRIHRPPHLPQLKMVKLSYAPINSLRLRTDSKSISLVAAIYIIILQNGFAIECLNWLIERNNSNIA
jgi:hypothetical protein